MVSELNAWVSEADYPTNGLSLAASAGSNRVGILVFTGEVLAAGPADVISATWGGQTVTLLTFQTCGEFASYNDFVRIGYINETQVAAMSGSAITVVWDNMPGTINFGTDGTGEFGNGKVSAAFFQDVDQANINSAENGATTGTDSATTQDNLSMGSIDTDLNEQVIVAGISAQGTSADEWLTETGWTREVNILGATNDHNQSVFTRDSQANDDALNVNFNCASANRLALVSISLGSASGITEHTGSPTDGVAFNDTIGVSLGVGVVDAVVFTDVIVGLVVVTRDQQAFQFFEDGTESGAASLQNQNVDLSIGKDTIFGVRVGMQAAGDPPSESATLQVRDSGDPDSEWRDVQ